MQAISARWIEARTLLAWVGMKRGAGLLVCLGQLWACGDDPRPATEEEARSSVASESLVNVGASALTDAGSLPFTVDVPVCHSGRLEVEIERIEEVEGTIVETGGVVRFLECELMAPGSALFDGYLAMTAHGPGYRGWRGEGLVDVTLDGARYEIHDFVLAIDEFDGGFWCIRRTVDLGDGGGEIVLGDSDCTIRIDPR